MSKLLWALSLGLALLVLDARPVHATVVVAKTVEQMAEEAAAVVRGVVRARQSSWDDGHRRIYTFTELELAEAWTGAPGPTVVIRTLGGEVGTVGMKVSGTARFEVGEEVVLFLRADPLEADQYQVIGMAQGKFRVDRESTTPMAVPDAGGLVFATRSGSGAMTVAHEDKGPRAVSLDELKRRVQAARKAPKTLVPLPPPATPTSPAAPPSPTPPATPTAPAGSEAGQN